MTRAINKNKNLFMAVSFLLWLPQFMYVPILSPYMEYKGIPYSFIGIVLGSYGLTQLLFRLPIGITSDIKKLRKPFIIFGMFSSMLSCFIFLTMDGPGWLLFARALAGLAAASWVAFTVLYPIYFSEDKVHAAMGSITFIVVLAQLLGMSFSGYIVDVWGWTAPFWIGAVFSIIGLILSFFIYEPKDKRASEPIRLKGLVQVIREASLWKVSLLSILAHSVIFSTMFGFTSTFALQIGFETNELTWIVLAFMIPHAIATLFMGNVLVPRLGEGRSLMAAFLLTSIFTAIIPFVQIKSLFLITQGFQGFVLGLTFPLLLGMSIKSIRSEKRATAMGAYQSIYALGIVIGPLLAGIVNSQFGIASGFYFVGGLALIAALLIVIWFKEEIFTYPSFKNKEAKKHDIV
ncbi:MFS transporter [Oceanobacillus sp. CFH 90083]|uniref:MFS transporter n=1 Tax=Oceanobacillus sp. CFH 90083 TaxID=2592336 RepID=UPI00128E6BBD|nr:MFS transporter [Oceanobacillus sp. CFH 90083]